MSRLLLGMAIATSLLAIVPPPPILPPPIENRWRSPATAAASPPSPSQALPPEEVQSYFDEIVRRNEFTSGLQPVRKWRSGLRIVVKGTPTQADLQTLAKVMAELRVLTGLTMQLVADDANVEIYFVPVDRFAAIEPNYIPGNMGFGWLNWEGNTLNRARILVSTVGVTQAERSHLIREELTQSLGLENDSWRYPDSIFYQGWTDVQEFTPLDRAIIHKLYRP